MAHVSSLFGGLISTFHSVGAYSDQNGTVVMTGFPYDGFRRFLKRTYKVGMFLERLTIRTWSKNVIIHEFFVPEMIYLLTQAAEKNFIDRVRAENLIESLYKNTWFGSSRMPIAGGVDLTVLNQFNFTPTPYQMEFLKDIYYQRRQQYQLRGYLLSLSPGLGKTLTSLFLSAGLHKKHTIVICPLSVLHNVWVPEIERGFKTQKKIWTVTQPLSEIDLKTDFVICNYEAIDKITPYVLKAFRDPKDVMVVVDEAHNLKDINSQRTKNTIALTDGLHCEDILLMTGTPVKALGVEAMPIFRLLDSYFTPAVMDEMKQLCRYPSVMNELLRNRMGMMMYRKLKTEVLQLPPKHEAELRLKIPDGKEFTLQAVQKKIEVYRKERQEFYKSKEQFFQQQYDECIELFKQTPACKMDPQAFAAYLDNLKTIKKHGYSFALMPVVVETNKYENEVIIPSIPQNKRNQFRNAKSAVKYVELKILGEILGNLLNQLRMDMTSSLVGEEVLDIIRKAEKKTILFSSYTDTIELAERVCIRAGMKPLCITGDNTKQAKILLDKFKEDPTINPLIASLKAMSTGHTILVANTVIFLNVPFRSVDYDQASDRVYRIGQDAEVFIYKLVLDTGEEPNLSTRMHDIINWSRNEFNALVGDDGNVVDAATKAAVEHNINKLTVGNEHFTENFQELLKDHLFHFGF